MVKSSYVIILKEVLRIKRWCGFRLKTAIRADVPSTEFGQDSLIRYLVGITKQLVLSLSGRDLHVYLIRNVMYCKPGQVKPVVEIFSQLSKIMVKLGHKSPMRIMTDVSGERYWTMVVEHEASSIEEFEDFTQKVMTDPKAQKAMKNYHEYVESGRREIFKLER